MVHRFGGQAGDALYVSGTIGAGFAGLAVLKGRAGAWDQLDPAGRDALAARYRQPEPRVLLAAVLRDFASAAMDISDGLIGDCDKLAAACQCSAAIRAERVQLPVGLEQVRGEALAELLTGGDDYEILAAVRPEQELGFRAAAHAVGVPVSRVGELTEGSGPTKVLFDGEPLPLYKRAYVHGGGAAT
jgi:thiamine-monophosphate kinase